jgi:hypothetical protein
MSASPPADYRQALMPRPLSGAAQYAMPLPRLRPCGAGAHPGGGVMGHAERNAARAACTIGKHAMISPCHPRTSQSNRLNLWHRWNDYSVS